MDPPTYAASSLSASNAEGSSSGISEALATPALLNLIPLPGEASFQQGYLGWTAASLQGSLQIKFTSSDGSVYRSTVTKVTVEFTGVERAADDDTSEDIELAKETTTLWERQVGESTSISQASGSGPPGNLDFNIRLTDDLPHCCHVGSGSIVYTLKARLHTTSNSTLVIRTPVHLSRSSPPLDTSEGSDSILPNTQAEIYTSEHPTDVAVYFPHGTSNFRRSESIELRVRMPPPEATLVQDKGLKLRSISAELHRKVSLRVSDNEDQETIALLEPPALDTLISHSGKAAAFSSSRSIFLNLWLQPVPAEYCEAITQSTILLDIKFSIRVIASFQGKSGDRQEIVILDKPVNIIPDYPPATSQDLGQPSSSLPSARLSIADNKTTSAPSTSSSGGANADLLRCFSEETEYDGYEEFSEEADPDDAPPHIDADQPPPALEASEAQPGAQIPFDPSPPPTPSLLRTTALSPSEATEEAPPYSSAALTSSDVPNVAIVQEVETSVQPPEHHSHHSDGATLPPPPYGDSR